MVKIYKTVQLRPYIACEQATVGDRTKENTASEASRGETVPRGELAEEELGGRKGAAPASLGSLRSRPFPSPFPSPYPATGACSQARPYIAVKSKN